MSERLAIVAADDAHAPALAAFFRETWDPSASPEKVVQARQRAAASNPTEPGRTPPTFIALQGRRVIGYCSTLPLGLWWNDAQHDAYWAKGLMVLPEFQGGPIGFHVLSALTKSQPLMAALTVAEGSKRLFGALGYRDYGAIPNLVRPTQLRLVFSQLRPRELVLNHPALRAATAGAALAQRVGLARAIGAVVDGISTPWSRPRFSEHTTTEANRDFTSSELDQLWRELRAQLGALPIRDSRTWRERYRQEEGSLYHFITMRRRGLLTGMAVLKEPKGESDPRLAGLRVASISDLLIDPDEPDLGALLAATEAHAANLGAGAVILSTANRRIAEVARRRGFLSRPGNVHFFLRATGQGVQWPTDLSSWWLTRGDGESDTTF